MSAAMTVDLLWAASLLFVYTATGLIYLLLLSALASDAWEQGEPLVAAGFAGLGTVGVLIFLRGLDWINSQWPTP